MAITVARQSENRTDLIVSCRYWEEMTRKINKRLNPATCAMIICYRRHLRLLKVRQQLLNKKSPLNYAVNAIRLMINLQEIETTRAELERHRALVNTLRSQLRIAVAEANSSLENVRNFSD